MSKFPRNPTFTADERLRLISLVKRKIEIILCKKTDFYSNRDKEVAWDEILMRYNSSTSIKRSKDSLKKLWEKLKSDAKHRQALSNKASGVIQSSHEDPVLASVIEIIENKDTDINDAFVSNFSSNSLLTIPALANVEDNINVLENPDNADYFLMEPSPRILDTPILDPNLSIKLLNNKLPFSKETVGSQNNYCWKAPEKQLFKPDTVIPQVQIQVSNRAQLEKDLLRNDTVISELKPNFSKNTQVRETSKHHNLISQLHNNISNLTQPTKETFKYPNMISQEQTNFSNRTQTTTRAVAQILEVSSQKAVKNTETGKQSPKDDKSQIQVSERTHSEKRIKKDKPHSPQKRNHESSCFQICDNESSFSLYKKYSKCLEQKLEVEKSRYALVEEDRKHQKELHRMKLESARLTLDIKKTFLKKLIDNDELPSACAELLAKLDTE